jgi:hypothetical protein
LKTLELNDPTSNEGESIEYSLIFKRFTPLQSVPSRNVAMDAEEKSVTSHWDKMVTIPDRPDELVFVLGVSNALLYSALPSANQVPTSETNGSRRRNGSNRKRPPFLAADTRTDFHDRYDNLLFIGFCVLDVHV